MSRFDKTSKILYPMEEEWDILIVLDACRYDYFEKVYDDYLEGDLEKVHSPGHNTGNWLKNSFPKKYEDVLYVSASPQINSIPNVGEFNTENWFYKIVDVWNSGWDNELGTVPPEKVNEKAIEAIQKHPEKRFIIHYEQPHAPYLSLGSLSTRDKEPATEVNLNSIAGKIRDLIASKIREFLGAKIVWMLADIFGIPPSEPIGAAVLEVGDEGLREAYEHNLRQVLKQISNLKEKLPSSKKIIVTADHGEFLGEDGRYGHRRGERDSILVEVPWFRVGEQN